MDYVLKLLRNQLRREKYFGRSAVVQTKGKHIAQANAQLVDERIPQLEAAIKILSTSDEVRSTSARTSNLVPRTSQNQLDLFK